MADVKHNRIKRARRHFRVRATLSGTPARPRLAVFRSGVHIYAQLIDDQDGKTLVSASSLKIPAGKSKKTDIARKVGTELARAASAQGITKAAFDRAGYRYHGRVKSLAEGAREAGLHF